MSFLDFDSALSELVSRGVPRERAIATLRAVPEFAPAAAERVERRDLILEKKEQAEIVKRFRVCGFKVYSLSQARASKQTPGIPDLWLTHRERGVALWWESKRQVGGKYSDAQLEFRDNCFACDTLCLGGDRYDAELWLASHGFAEIIGTDFYPRRLASTGGAAPRTED